MANLNKVLLLGNVTRDPEVRYTPKGSAVCDLGVAVNRAYTTDSGEKREEVTFVDVTLWGRTAEVASEYLKKGRPVFIEGRLQMDTWDDKQTGQKRTRCAWWPTTCNCSEVGLQAEPTRPEKAGKPAHRLKNRRLPNRTKTRFRFEVARASGLAVGPIASGTLALLFL
jgi:single stranded DNA-binding protein (ssb)